MVDGGGAVVVEDWAQEAVDALEGVFECVPLEEDDGFEVIGAQGDDL